MCGSFLVLNDTAYFAAGRSSFLDGGMRICRLDAGTGRLLCENTIGDRLPDSDDNLQTKMKGLDMPTALPDVLSSDGDRIYMRSQAFNYDGTRLPLKAKAWNGQADMGAPPPDQDTDHSQRSAFGSLHA